MAQIFKGRVYSSTPYPSAEINYEYTRDGANMKYRFTGKVYLESSGGWYYNNLQLKLYLEGSNVYTKDCKSSSKGWSISFDSDWKTVENKTSGTTSFYFTVKDTQNSSWCNYTSSTYNLYVAPAYFTSTPTLTVAGLTETSVTINWSTSENASQSQYKIDNGSWVDVETSIDKKSGTMTITGLTAGKSYTIYGDFKRKDSGLWALTKPSVSVTTYDYPKPSSINDFTIGEGASVSMYNPLDHTYKLELISNVDGSVIGTYEGAYKYVINSEFKTTDAINRQYASLKNAQSGTYYAKVTYGNSVKTLGTGTYRVKGDEVPTFTNFTYKDINTIVTNVTGNNQVLVKGLSTLEVTIPSANKMVANNYADPKNYNISIDNLSETVNYSTSDVVKSMGSISSSGTKRLTVRAYDTRTLSTPVYKDITIYDYAKPVINASLSRLNNFEAQSTLKVEGTFTKLNIGGTDKNSITTVQYRYREVGGSWGSWTTLNTTVTSGKFTCSDVILSLDNTKSFEVEIKAEDKLQQTNISSKTLDVGQAIFFISSNKKECYINGQVIVMYDVVDTW